MTWRSAAKRIAAGMLPLIAVGGADAFDLVYSSAIIEAGWLLSRRRGLPVDRYGEPLPWYTYSTISFLVKRLPNGIDVFEYGCGYSTLWWMRRAQSVMSVEHAGPWVQTIRQMADPNVHIVEVSADQEKAYVKAIESTATLFDVVVVDGECREACLALAPKRLKSGGIIILDNSERTEYRNGIAQLCESGFRQVDFIGMGPINTYEWMTSIFYRNGNCLNL